MSKKKKNRWQFIRQKFPKRMQKKLVLLFMAIVLAFVCLVGKITKINVSKGEQYTKIVLNQQQYNSAIIPYRRGDIVDRNGTVLATSERVYNVILDFAVMLSSEKEDVKTKTVEQVKEVLNICLGTSGEAIEGLMTENPKSRYTVVERKISYEKAKELKSLLADKEKYPYISSSIWMQEDYQRAYPYGTLASDVIGFTVSGNVGNSGLETFYNSILNGTDGRKYGYLDTDSTVEYTIKEPINGYTVVSTIDITLQSIVEKHILAFNEEHKNEATQGEGSLNTAVIIMDPNTGEILAEASYPNYDLNNPRDLSAYYSEQEIEAMTDEEKLDVLNQIWRNYCVSDSFEPGSTAKTFTIAAGLENGALKGNETYDCTGSLKVPGATIPCHKRQGHGIQTLSDAIANSCNVVLMHVANKIGVEEFCKFQSIFNLGHLTGIDLPGESEGLLFSPDKMGPTELATCSFGQGFNVTMTQMVAAYASVINGGYYYEPHMVKQIQDDNGNVVENKAPVLVKQTISEETSELMKQYMHQTMTTGTGKNAQVEGYDMGAKTGTAQKIPRDSGKHILSYMGYAPADNPEVLVYVVIDEPNVERQDLSKYVTDLSREIMTEAFPYLNITKATATE